MKRYKVTHIMNKKQLIIILVAGLLSSTASALNLNPKAAVLNDQGDIMTDAVLEGTVVIASEIKASDLDTVEGVAYNVTGQSGFIIPAGTGYFARFDLEGATFASALVKGSVDGLGDAFEIAAGGGAGDDYAVVSVGNSTSGLVTLTQPWTLSGVMYDISSKEDVIFTYTLHQGAGDAVNEESPLNTQSGLLIKFAAATGMAAKAATNTKQIDVVSSGLLFVGGSKVSTIMEINLTTTKAGAINPDPAEELPTLVIIAKSVDLTVTGNFGSINLGDKDADPVVAPAGKVWLDDSPECLISSRTDNTPLDTGDDNFTDNNHNLGLLKINRVGNAQVTAEVELPVEGRTIDEYAKAYLCLETDGKTEIPEGRYGGKLEMTANTGFDPHPDVTLAQRAGSELEKNAADVEVQLLLTPNGVFSNYVRLSNTSSVPVDNLEVTLYNDAGDSQRFKLSAIEGVSDELAPYASTKLININALYAAAQAEPLEDDKEMFAVTGGEFGNKLRARVDGSFQEGAIDIQALSVSTDRTTFFSF